jgi:Ca2+-binding RTX toxin-like protein
MTRTAPRAAGFYGVDLGPNVSHVVALNAASGAGDDRLVGGAGADTFQIFSAHGVDRIADFGWDDRLTLTRDVNGTGIASLEDVTARIADASGGATLDLGGGDAAIFEGWDAVTLRAALADDGFAFFG